MRAVLNPVEIIAKKGTGTVNGKERLFEAYKNCSDLKEFTRAVNKEYHYYGCGRPIELDKPFPQLCGYSFMQGPNFKVEINNKKKKRVVINCEIKSLAETIWALIENDNY